jgi:hypothetical protein
VLRNHGCLEGLSQSNQISLFNIWNKQQTMV